MILCNATDECCKDNTTGKVCVRLSVLTFSSQRDLVAGASPANPPVVLLCVLLSSHPPVVSSEM